MEIKRPTVGHMHQFLQEREDWRKMFAFIAKWRYRTTELTDEELHYAMTLANKNAAKQFPNYQMFQYPTSFQAVDNVIIWREAGKILLGRKPGKKLWQFPGGFVDPKDQSLEEGCMRERQEECADEKDSICSRPEYLASFRVDDPRYKDSPDKIMSAVFISYFISGKVRAGDDLKEVKWFTKDYLRRRYDKCLLPMHHPVIEILVRNGYM